MSSYIGEVVKKQQSSNNKSLDKRQSRGKSRFTMMVHPDKWKWNGERYIPKFGKMVAEPGVQGVRLIRGKIDDSPARAHYIREGWIIIENGDSRLKDILEDGSYLTKYPCANGRYAYVYAWQKPYEMMGRTHWEVNKNLMNAVQDIMLEKEIIPQMSIRLKEHYIEAAKEQLFRAENIFAADNNSVNKSRLAKRKSNLAALIKDLKSSQND